MIQDMPVIMLYEFTISRRKNIMPARLIPIFQANFFGAAATYSGACRLTINRPIINKGENLGLIKTRTIRSVRKRMMKYLIKRKSSLKRINTSDMNISTKRIPADARISRSFSTGTSYPGTFSPNLVKVFCEFIFFVFRNVNCKSLLTTLVRCILPVRHSG